MFIADMHCDTLSDVNSERGLVNSYNTSKRYPFLQFFAHFSKKGVEEAPSRRRRLMNAFNVFIEETERLGLMRISSAKDLFAAEEEGRSAAMFTVEGGGGLFADSPELLTLAKAGLSVLGMAWDKNELSASAYEDVDEGLTDEGRKMALRCAELGIILDVSHLSDRAFWELYELSPMPHIATHSDFRELCGAKRNLTRDMAREIASRGGVIGVNLYPPFLREDGVAGVDDIIRHVDYGLELVGQNCMAFGFDIDGTDGKYPSGISLDDSIHDQITEALLARYSSTVVEKIAGKNVIEFLKGNLI